MTTTDQRSFGFSIAVLVANSTTLVCCVLPAALVSLGAGAALVGLVTAVPQLIWLSEHKVEVFLVAACFLLIGGPTIWWAWRLPCPADPVLGRSCMRLRKASVWLYVVSVGMFVTGAVFAFAF
jgi:hypothetical protein